MKDGIACPACGSHRSSVVDSRQSENAIRRRRLCINCKKRYTTYEYAFADLPDEMFPKKYKLIPWKGMVPIEGKEE